MAIYRNIHISFWEDSKVLDDMSIEDRYFMLYLLTNPHSNQIGCFEISKRQIINETGFDKKKVDELLEKFEKELKIIIYSPETKELFIKNWHKYNWSNSPKVMACVKKEFLNVKSPILKEELEKMFKEIYCINTVLKEYRYSMDRVGIKEEEEKEEEQEKEKEEEETVNANASTTPIFDFSLILEYGMKKGADESYCRKFYDYYEKKKWKSGRTKIKDWKSKFDEWIEEDKIEPSIYELKKVSEGAFKL
jgi:hypothetical protein